MPMSAALHAQAHPAAPAGAQLLRRHTHDADELASCLGDWNQVYEQLAPGRFEGHFLACRLGDIQIFREQTNRPLYEAGQVRPDQHVVGVPVRMRGAGRCGQQAIAAQTVLSIRGGSELDCRIPDDFDIVAASIPNAALQAHCREFEQRDFEPAAGTVVEPHAHAVHALRSQLLAALDSAAQMPQRLQHAALRRSFTRELLALVLRVVMPATPAPAPAPAQRHAVVARAQAFMRAHVDQALSVEDLCRALHVSRRTLQYSFQDMLQINPASYLRAMRLNGARRMLRQADPAQLSVADVAAHWGFWHLSRFATDYRRMFDELPSHTLRSGRRS